MEKLYRQGDVLLRRVDDAPKGVPPSKDVHVLAEGEISGHAHKVFGGAVMFRDDGLARSLGQQAYMALWMYPQLVRKSDM